MPFQRLAEDARVIVALANDIAHEYERDYVGTEHMLLAILRQNNGVGAAVLHKFNINESNARDTIEAIEQRDKEDTWVFGRLPGTPSYRNVIATAIEEATQLEAKHIGGEHLLLALLREKGSTAQRALAKLGVTLTNCRNEVLRQLSKREKS